MITLGLNFRPLTLAPPRSCPPPRPFSPRTQDVMSGEEAVRQLILTVCTRASTRDGHLPQLLPWAARALYSVGAGVVYHYAYSEGRAPLVAKMAGWGLPCAHSQRALAASHRLSEVSAWLSIVENLTESSASMLTTGAEGEEGEGGQKQELEKELMESATAMWKAAQIFIGLGAPARSAVCSLLYAGSPTPTTPTTPTTPPTPPTPPMPDSAASTRGVGQGEQLVTTSHASGLPVATARGTDPVTAQVGRDLAEKVGSESGWMAPPSESGGLVFQKLWSSPVVSLVSSDAPVPVGVVCYCASCVTLNMCKM